MGPGAHKRYVAHVGKGPGAVIKQQPASATYRANVNVHRARRVWHVPSDGPAACPRNFPERAMHTISA